MGERGRLFVAVWPPGDVLDLVEALPRPGEPGVRYTARDQWHVTLRFLGGCDVDDAAAALDGARWPEEHVEAVCGPAVSRLGRDVIVVPVRGLDALAAAVAAATRDLGEPPDPRPFAGHLTLARLRSRGACRIAGAPFAVTFPVTEVALVRSHLQPGGARYETLRTWPQQ